MRSTADGWGHMYPVGCWAGHTAVITACRVPVTGMQFVKCFGMYTISTCPYNSPVRTTFLTEMQKGRLQEVTYSESSCLVTCVKSGFYQGISDFKFLVTNC